MSTFVYLACPYSHEDPKVRLARYRASCKAAARLMECGCNVFSPIAHSHAIETIGKPENPNHDFWMAQDRAILKHASELVVLAIPGFQHSKGVKEEIAIADAIGIPVWHCDQYGEETVPDYTEDA